MSKSERFTSGRIVSPADTDKTEYSEGKCVKKQAGPVFASLKRKTGSASALLELIHERKRAVRSFYICRVDRGVIRPESPLPEWSFGHSVKGVAAPSGKEAKVMKFESLLTKLKTANSNEKCADVLDEILKVRSDIDDDFLAEVRYILSETRNDLNRACLFQLLGELNDNQALEMFLGEMRAALGKNVSEPPLAAIFALTYIRFLDGPLDRSKLLKLIAKLATKFLNAKFTSKKEFKAGIIATLRILGLPHLKESTDLLAIMLQDEDPRTVESAMYAAASIWRRVDTTDEEVGDKYRCQVSRALVKGIRSSLEEVNAIPQAELSPKLNNVLEAVELLGELNPELASTVIPEIFQTALDINSDYMLAAILETMPFLSESLMKETFAAMSKRTGMSVDAISVKLIGRGHAASRQLGIV